MARKKHPLCAHSREWFPALWNLFANSLPSFPPVEPVYRVATSLRSRRPKLACLAPRNFGRQPERSSGTMTAFAHLLLGAYLGLAGRASRLPSSQRHLNWVLPRFRKMSGGHSVLPWREVERVG